MFDNKQLLNIENALKVVSHFLLNVVYEKIVIFQYVHLISMSMINCIWIMLHLCALLKRKVKLLLVIR